MDKKKGRQIYMPIRTWKILQRMADELKEVRHGIRTGKGQVVHSLITEDMKRRGESYEDIKED